MDIVNNGKIDISEEVWESLNRTYSKDFIKQAISDAIVEHGVPLPMREISLKDAKESFQKLVELDTSSLLIDADWFTRYEYNPSFPLTRMVLKSNNIGNLASDYFQQKERWKCDSINSPSPFRTWTTEKFRLTLLNALWSLKVKKVDAKELRSIIGLRKYIASQFRPSAAKAVYDYFGAKDVLDFSSGWGDRLLGFLASEQTSSYVGIDPNANLVHGYEGLLRTFNTTKNVTLIEGCAENQIIQEKSFDLVFTSPPYFNIERYTQENNQSFKKYRKLDAWLNEFLFVSLEKAWGGLRRGGHMVINISDVYSNHRINNICDPMNLHLAKQCGARYIGCWGYEMRKRPNSGALRDKTGVFGEPMWVWQKT